MNLSSNTPIRLALAGTHEKDAILRARHQVYAVELGQYPSRSDGVLPDADDVQSVYISASSGGELLGFVGITPPDSPRFSIDRHLRRAEWPFPRDKSVFEVRALTVLSPQRGSIVAAALMYAALRWIEARGGTRLVAIGRREVLDMYRSAGLQPTGQSCQTGAVTYSVLTATVEQIRGELKKFDPLLARMEQQLDWQMGIGFQRPSDCYHGGAFFDAIGDEFDDLRRRDEIINADVLDAWFPPAPAVTEALRDHFDWIIRTSPPNQAGGLCRQIAKVRGVDPANVLAGGGSSPLIFLALRQWLRPSSRVLLLEPTYGEYSHVLEHVVRCQVDRLVLKQEEEYQLKPERVLQQLAKGHYDLFVWVNPNNPTGHHVPRVVAQEILKAVPPETRVWLDETYVDYIGPDQSLERFAARSENVVVCKSLSKSCALSGLRVGYLCAPPPLLEDLRGLTPPWSVSLAGQIAAVAALQSPAYYAERYRETHELRRQLYGELQAIGITEIVPGCANFLMMHLPAEYPDAARVIRDCRDQGLFLRDIRNMGATVGSHALRIAVKDAVTNERIVAILRCVLRERDRRAAHAESLFAGEAHRLEEA
jgi:histidinol-phosphate/aromatic aminotransferase/cobyric acid decarboxylase-like protein